MPIYLDSKTKAVSCANCAHWDGDKFCSLPVATTFVLGPIMAPKSVVCAKHEAKERD